MKEPWEQGDPLSWRVIPRKRFGARLIDGWMRVTTWSSCLIKGGIAIRHEVLWTTPHASVPTRFMRHQPIFDDLCDEWQFWPLEDVLDEYDEDRPIWCHQEYVGRHRKDD